MLTGNRTYDTPPTVGRKKLFPVRITLPLTAEMVARLDATLDKDAGEDRVSSIREAIELHLKRRERTKRIEGEKPD